MSHQDIVQAYAASPDKANNYSRRIVAFLLAEIFEMLQKDRKIIDSDILVC